MQCILLCGSKDAREKFLAEFISRHALPPIRIYTFSSILKIADVRYIQKILSYKTSFTQLFIISGEITLEAQNSLLKTLEELPDSTYIIFSYSDSSNLLPTICSRAQLITLSSSSETSAIIALADEIEKYIDSPLLLYEKIENIVGKENACDSLIEALHYLLVADETKRITIYTVLKAIYIRYPLIKHNNVSFKMSLDIAFLEQTV